MLRWIVRLLLLVVVFNVLLVLNTVWWSHQSEDRFPPIGEHVAVEGLSLHLVDTGVPTIGNAEAPPLVLIHGASTSLLDMHSALRPVLEQGHRVILIDRPGHGYSERAAGQWSTPADQARLIRGALAERGIEQSIWIGHSWGGSVVMAGLLDSPEAVIAGVSVAGVSHPWDGGTSWHAEMADRPVTGTAFAWQYIQPGGRLGLEAAIQSVFDPETIPANYVDRTGVTLSLRPDVFLNNAADLNRLSDYLVPQVPSYASIVQPVLLITGDADDVVPAWNHAERLAKVLPETHWMTLQGAGHGLHHTRAPAIGAAISTFSRCISALESARPLDECMAGQTG